MHSLRRDTNPHLVQNGELNLLFLQFCSRQSLAAVSLHSLTVYHDKMESLPKGWQSVRHGLYANDNTGGRAGAKPPCQCELQKQQFAESSGKPPCNHFTLYSTDSKVTKKTTFFFGSWELSWEWEVDGVCWRLKMVYVSAYTLRVCMYSTHQSQSSIFAKLTFLFH